MTKGPISLITSLCNHIFGASAHRMEFINHEPVKQTLSNNMAICVESQFGCCGGHMYPSLVSAAVIAGHELCMRQTNR